MDKQQRWYAEEIELKNQVIADVGANVGKLSQFFWDAGSGTNTVFSIEPLPQNIKRLKVRISRSKTKKWSVLPFVVSDQSGERRLRRFHSQEQGWNSAVTPAGESASTAPGVKEIIIQARSLTELVPNATVVKLDIEGHEYTVIDQAIGKLGEAHTWAVELHMVKDRPLQRVIEQFEDNGFQVVAASQRPSDPSGRWISVPVSRSLGWDQIPVAKHLSDGSVFKMLHIIAKRER